MTRQDVVSTLQRLATGRLREAPPSWSVEEREGGLVIEADGERFDVEVRSSTVDHDPMSDILGPMSGDQREAFWRGLDEAAAQAEREGPVSPGDLRRILDEGKARGLKAWNSRHGIVD